MYGSMKCAVEKHIHVLVRNAKIPIKIAHENISILQGLILSRFLAVFYTIVQRQYVECVVTTKPAPSFVLNYKLTSFKTTNGLLLMDLSNHEHRNIIVSTTTTLASI